MQAKHKINELVKAQSNMHELLWNNQANRPLIQAHEGFEVLIDCLIFFILKFANMKVSQDSTNPI